MNDIKLSQQYREHGINCLEPSTLASIPFRNSDSIIRNAECVESPQSTQYIKSPVTVDKISLVLPNRPRQTENQITPADTYTEPVRPFWTIANSQPDSRESDKLRQTFQQYGIPQPLQGSIPTQPIPPPCNHIHSQKLVLDQVVPHYWYSLNSGAGTGSRSFNIGRPSFQLRRYASSYINRLISKFL